MHKIFDYLENLDCFVINPAYKRVADYLGLTEWHEAVLDSEPVFYAG